MSASDTVLVEQYDRVVLLTLNRPNALNALNNEMMRAMIDTLVPLDKDPNVGCFVLTGSKKAFAAGADIKELADNSYVDVFHRDLLAEWNKIANLRTPKIAAVSGYALGGGCELAMMCDTIFAADNALFGQPEIKLGLIPGMGGSQRLTRLVGKSKAMDMVLTGRMIDATEAERTGLVSRVIDSSLLLVEALQVAHNIANYSKTTAIAAREAVNHALETGLGEGVLHERRLYHALWATDDAQEGMQAFIEKRDPVFKGR